MGQKLAKEQKEGSEPKKPSKKIAEVNSVVNSAPAKAKSEVLAVSVPSAGEKSNDAEGIDRKKTAVVVEESTQNVDSGSGSASISDKSTDYSNFSKKMKIEDFDLLKVLGKGSFGKVMLVKKKDDKTGTLHAMKTLRKAALVKRNQLAHTSTERKILQNIHCPFLVHLVYAFQTTDKLYMVLDYMAGGELFFWLKKDRRFSENRSRLYSAEITLALEALHSEDIVYRDLKPENILLDATGHIRLTDFGLAKSNITGFGAEGGTKTFCGTPEYLAPEILENKGHGKAVDWWALGTLLFEMLTGLPPFYDTNVQRMYHKILHEPLRFPKGEGRQLTEDARDFLKGLLERRTDLRTGSTSGAADLKRSRFYSTLDFEKVIAKKIPAEFIPPFATSETDVRNFDKEFTSEPAADSMVVSHMSQTMQEKTTFEGFTYTADHKGMNK
jgi:serum/glucocorticoid-regulated kinase 2